MLEAWDNRRQKNLPVEAYVATYGPKSDSRYRPGFRPKLRCLICSGTLHTFHEGTPAARWVHDPNPARKCPAKSPSRILQGLPSPVAPNLDGGTVLRTAFFRNWGRHWSRARRLCQNAKIESFVAFVAEADATGMWGRVGVREGFIPYLFLASRDFPPLGCRVMRSAQAWQRFAFDWRIQSLADLDSCNDGAPQFVRMTFRAPVRGEPKFDGLVRQEPIALNTTYVFLPALDLAESDVMAMEEAFPRELGVACVMA